MSDILDEVLIDNKDEKRIAFFRKIFPLVIVATIVIAIIMASFNWYGNRATSHNQKIGSMLVDLMDKKHDKQDLTIDSLTSLIKDSDNRQTELAEILRVDYLVKNSEKDEALQKLEAIIANTNYCKITTSFARLLWLNLILDKNPLSDELKIKAHDYMQYFKDSSQVFFINATLLKAMFYKRNNENAMAAEYANIILNLDSSVSFLIKQQARAILATL